MQQDQSVASTTPTIRILKIGSCPTLSGSGTLEYCIGHEATDGILFRITSNSGSGWYSGHWVSLKSIQAAIDDAPKPLTSYALHVLFMGRSVNTMAFLWAILKQEGLVTPAPDNERAYIAVSPDAFMSEMTKLIDVGTDLRAPQKITDKTVKASNKDDVPVLASPSKSKPDKSKTAPNKA